MSRSKQGKGCFGRFAVALIAAAVGSPAAWASTTLTISGSAPPDIAKAETVTASTNPANLGVRSGVLTGAYQATNTATNSQFWVYCLSMLTWAQSPYTYTATDLASYIGTTNASGYAQQFANSPYGTAGYKMQNQATVLANLNSLIGHAYLDSLTSATKAAAFAYALWEIEGDTPGTALNPYSTAGGSLTAAQSGQTGYDASFVTQANAYLKAVSANDWTSLGLVSTASFVATVYQPTTAGGSQSFLAVTANSGNNQNGSVPEPGSIALVAACALGWVGARKVSRRNEAG